MNCWVGFVSGSNGVSNKLPSMDVYPNSAPNSPAHGLSSGGYNYNNANTKNYASNTGTLGTLSYILGTEGVPLLLREDLLKTSNGNSSVSNNNNNLVLNARIPGSDFYNCEGMCKGL
jgi:hypothetical protein